MAERGRTQLSAAGSVQVKSGKGELHSIFVISAATGELEIWDSTGLQAQVETATVSGLIEAAGAGDVDIIVTAVGMTNTPKTLSVAVANDDTAIEVAVKLLADLVADADIGHPSTGFFTVTLVGAVLTFTANTVATDDSTMNIDIDETGSTAVGLDDADTSALVQAGMGETDAALLYQDTNPSAGFTQLDLPYTNGLHVSMAVTPGRINFVYGR